MFVSLTTFLFPDFTDWFVPVGDGALDSWIVFHLSTKLSAACQNWFVHMVLLLSRYRVRCILKVNYQLGTLSLCTL